MRSAAIVILLAVTACSTSSWTDQARDGLRSQIWMLEARPQRGQTADQARSDWTACEESVAANQGEKGFAGSGFMPVGSYVSMVGLYKAFDVCMKERGYILAERGK